MVDMVCSASGNSRTQSCLQARWGEGGEGDKSRQRGLLYSTLKCGDEKLGE